MMINQILIMGLSPMSKVLIFMNVSKSTKRHKTSSDWSMCHLFLFVWVEALRPSPQFFSHVGTKCVICLHCVRSYKILHSKRIYSASEIWLSFFSSCETCFKTNIIALKRDRLN